MNDLTLFERFVDNTHFIVLFLEARPWLGLLLSGSLVLFNWFIFRYHASMIEEPEALLLNVHITGRFCSSTYNNWKWLGMTIAPAGLLVLAYSVLTRFDTIEFIRFFGIRTAARRWSSVKDLPRNKKP